jgi:hypothetical protein
MKFPSSTRKRPRSRAHSRTRKYKSKTLSRRAGGKRKPRGMRGTKKKWVTAIAAAQKSLNATGSVKKAHKMLRTQALENAKKLFGRNN